MAGKYERLTGVRWLVSLDHVMVDWCAYVLVERPIPMFLFDGWISDFSLELDLVTQFSGAILASRITITLDQDLTSQPLRGCL